MGLGIWRDRIDVEARMWVFLPSLYLFSLIPPFHLGFWSDTGSIVTITAEDSFYILRFDRDAYNAKLEEGVEITDECVEEAFEVVADVSQG